MVYAPLSMPVRSERTKDVRLSTPYSVLTQQALGTPVDLDSMFPPSSYRVFFALFFGGVLSFGTIAPDPHALCPRARLRHTKRRLKGLLLLKLSCGGGESGSLAPRARLQLPCVPIQAGFLDGDLVVALPSASSAK